MHTSILDDVFHPLSTRNEIATCEESAYDSLPFKDAALLLFFSDRNEVIAFAQEVRYLHFDLI